MRVQKGDIVVASTVEGNTNRKNTFLGKVLSVNGASGKLDVAQCRHYHIQKLRVIHEGLQESKHVHLNLGPDPILGSVYGHDISSVRRFKLEHDHLGDVHFFYRPEKQVKESLIKAGNIAAKRLAKAGIEKILEDELVWEVKPFTNEKYAGMYHWTSKDDFPNRIEIFPEKMTAQDFPYVFLHELGHHVHMNYARKNEQLESKWLSIFNTTIEVVNVPREECVSLLKELITGDTKPSRFKTSLEDDEKKDHYTLILRWIAREHSISVRDLDTLFRTEKFDEIEYVWPKKTVLAKRSLKPEVSEYGTKNVKELVAESIAFHLCGKKLPRKIEKLLEQTFNEVRNG